jgi:hypothetical protein
MGAAIAPATAAANNTLVTFFISLSPDYCAYKSTCKQFSLYTLNQQPKGENIADP